MRKRILIIGPTQSGKSTLANLLNGTTRPLRKTQDMIYGQYTMDTPGAYIENPSMYRYLIAAAQEASHLLLLADQTRPVLVYPPQFVCSFNCPVTGVITKSDLAPENNALCLQQLRQAGVEPPCYSLGLNCPEELQALKVRLAQYLHT